VDTLDYHTELFYSKLTRFYVLEIIFRGRVVSVSAICKVNFPLVHSLSFRNLFILIYLTREIDPFIVGFGAIEAGGS
jgi:hypothetical protein